MTNTCDLFVKTGSQLTAQELVLVIKSGGKENSLWGEPKGKL